MKRLSNVRQMRIEPLLTPPEMIGSFPTTFCLLPKVTKYDLKLLLWGVETFTKEKTFLKPWRSENLNKIQENVTCSLKTKNSSLIYSLPKYILFTHLTPRERFFLGLLCWIFFYIELFSFWRNKKLYFTNTKIMS